MSGELRVQARPTLRDPTLLLAFEGWNDAGESASAAARYVADAIAAAPLAEIDPETFYDFTVRRPRVEMTGEGQRRIAWPENRLCYGSMAPERDLVVGIGIEPHLRWRRYAELLVGLGRDLGIRRVVLLGAYLADVLYSRPVGVTGFAWPDALLEGLGVRSSGYEGPTGIVGVLGTCFADEELEVVSLWAALPHYISAQPNPRGALALVQVLRGVLGLPLDTAPLERRAAEFEERINALVAADPELAEYVRQLKRREFAQ